MSILSFLTDAAGAAQAAKANRAGASNADDGSALPFSTVLSQQTRQTVAPAASNAAGNTA